MQLFGLNKERGEAMRTFAETVSRRNELGVNVRTVGWLALSSRLELLLKICKQERRDGSANALMFLFGRFIDKHTKVIVTLI